MIIRVQYDKYFQDYQKLIRDVDRPRRYWKQSIENRHAAIIMLIDF